MNVNLREPCDRTNLYTQLLKFQAACEADQANRERRFDQLLQIWDKTSEVLWAEGYWQDYLKCGEVALYCAAQLGKSDIEGRILNELGWAQMEQGKFDIAKQNFIRSLQVFQFVGDQISQGQSLRYLGVLHFRRRYFGQALNYYQKALQIAKGGLKQNSDDPRLLHQRAEIHNLLGNLYLKLWNIQACRRELVIALREARDLHKCFASPTSTPYAYFQAAPLLNLGRVAMLTKAHSKAKNYFDRCYRLSKELDRLDTMAGALLRLAELAKEQGHFETADQLAKQAEDISGKEIPPLRNQSASLRSQIRGNRRQQLKERLHQVKMISVLITDLAIHTPMVLLQSIINYCFFVVPKWVR